MNRFWEIVIRPLLYMTNSVNIVEIGAEFGKNTIKLLEYCKRKKGVLHVIDPAPQFNVGLYKNKYGNTFQMHRDFSLNVLPKLKNYDAVLIDGDHNWFTVYNELKIIERNIGARGEFPMVLIHDTAWPYGRRDLYYFPKGIPPLYRKPYAKKGMQQGRSELLEQGGFNLHLYNALYENGDKNGVLTAIEDFLRETYYRVSFFKSMQHHGLGILMPGDLSGMFAVQFNKLPL